MAVLSNKRISMNDLVAKESTSRQIPQQGQVRTVLLPGLFRGFRSPRPSAPLPHPLPPTDASRETYIGLPEGKSDQFPALDPLLFAHRLYHIFPSYIFISAGAVLRWFCAPNGAAPTRANVTGRHYHLQRTHFWEEENRIHVACKDSARQTP